ncbi:hypothetical protein SAMN04488542_11896 [Fontibacillus panacisegetis]|uniref:Transposase, Mutator family n=1 Tax=Fontibacillus panacisegetis TaxID=670482 RepID=A0A1G7PI31_9BACL|nr:hypothetical protein [Fontibacillus panacisegetis]SDF85339.1 hypothetical protein SAMN04488542_11896 [Fontibacillus panacisegetis]
MNVERTFKGNESFISLLLPLIDAEIDRIIEQQDSLMYNDGNANTSHSEEVA